MDVPVYRRQQSPTVVQPFYQPVKDVKAFNIISTRAEQRLQELDDMAAIEAFNSLRDADRDSFNSYFERKGADSVGVSAEYGKGVHKVAADIAKERLAGHRQKDKFQLLVSQHINQNMDALARHESTEHQARKVQARKNNLAQSLVWAGQRAGNNKAIDDLVLQQKLIIRANAAGEDLLAEEISSEATIRTQAIKQNALTNPAKALEQIDEWGSMSGMDAYSLARAKNEAETRLKTERIKGIYAQTLALNSYRPNDNERGIDATYQAQVDFVNDMKLPYDEAKPLKAMLAAGHTEKLNGKIRADNYARVDALSNVVTLKNKGELQAAFDALEAIPNDILNNVEKEQWRAHLISARTSMGKQRNPELISKLEDMIIRGEIQYDFEIDKYLGQGVDPHGATYLKSLRKEYDEAAKEVVGVLKARFDQTFPKGEFANKYKWVFETWMRNELRDPAVRKNAGILVERAGRYLGSGDTGWGGMPKTQFGRDIRTAQVTSTEEYIKKFGASMPVDEVKLSAEAPVRMKLADDVKKTIMATRGPDGRPEVKIVNFGDQGLHSLRYNDVSLEIEYLGPYSATRTGEAPAVAQEDIGF